MFDVYNRITCLSNIFAAIQEALDDDELTNTNDIGKRTILSKSVVGSQRYFKTAYYVSFLTPCFFPNYAIVLFI